MSSPRITFTYTLPAEGVDPWWVRIEQEELPDDTATLADAAELLDTLYDLDPCAEEEESETVEEEPDPPADEVEGAVDATIDQIACEFDADFNVDVVVRVIRSHQTEPYRLALQGGRLASTETVREMVTLNVPVENASSITLNYPVISNFSCSWRGVVFSEAGRMQSPTLTRTGNTLVFGAEVKTGNITATFLTEYDRCTVTVLGVMTSNLDMPEGVEMTPGECRALAFFHGLVADQELETPEAADEIGSCTMRWGVDPTDYEIECYQAVTVSTRCECTDREVSSRTYDEVVDCPEQVTRCPGNDTKCRHLVGSVTVPEYVECTDDNEITGMPGMIYSLSTPDYYEERCCKKPSFPLPQCPEKTVTYRGGMKLQGGAGQYRAIYGPTLRITPVSPPGGICGTWTIRQEVDSSDCCDGVPPLVWDTAISPEVMAPNSSVVVGVTGGRSPYTWTVEGSGFCFSGYHFSGLGSITTNGLQARLSSLVLACGTATITVTDGCSTIVGEVRSTAGRWDGCYVYVVDISIGANLGRHRPAVVCDDGCSMEIGEMVYTDPPSGSCVTVNALPFIWFRDAWARETTMCYISGNSIMDSGSAYRARDQLVANGIVVANSHEEMYAMVPSSETRCASKGACRWVC